MKRILWILMCLVFVGCANTSKKLQIIELKESLLKKDEEIKKLQDLLQEKESMLKEKDLKMGELRKKLEGLGVFE
jgi:uncharacterized protein YxeA